LGTFWPPREILPCIGQLGFFDRFPAHRNEQVVGTSLQINPPEGCRLRTMHLMQCPTFNTMDSKMRIELDYLALRP
jgi:hypothetical protein